MPGTLPIHQFLWDITLPVVRATWAKGRAYVESGKYVPRFEPPPYKVSDSGWPLTVAPDRLGVPDAKDAYVIAETARLRRDLTVVDTGTDLVRELAVLTGIARI